MPEFKDLTGQKFGKWTALYRVADHITKSGYKFTAWRCRCDCGVEKDVTANSLLSGASTSCGCARREHCKEAARKTFTTHGESKTRLYKIWVGIKKRCYDKNSYGYPIYGSRGIGMCDEWKDNFLVFKQWACSNGYADDLTIDRISVDGDYEPSNCRWVDCVAQANNRRNNHYITYNGERKSIAMWSRELGIPARKFYKKMKQGKSFEEIIKSS